MLWNNYATEAAVLVHKQWVVTFYLRLYFLRHVLMGSKGGTVVRAEHLPPTNVAWGSNPGINAICGLTLLLVLSFAPRGFSPDTPVFPSLKTNISKFFDQESGRRRTTMWMRYLQIVIYWSILFIYLKQGQMKCIKSLMAANRGDNNGRTLIGMVKRWPLNRGLSSRNVLRLFWDFYYWHLNRGWLPNRWPLNGDATVVYTTYYSWGEGGGVLELIFAEYVLASQSPYPITV